MLAEITKEQALWLVEFYSPKREYRVDHSTVPMYLKAYNLMKGGDRKIECTACEGKAIAQMAKSMYGQYEADIRAIAYPVEIQKRGRKKKNG